MKIIHILLIVFLSSLVISQSNYTLQLHPVQSGARCLDGSPAGLYYHEGSGKNKDKYMIYMDSGGFCAGLTIDQTLQSCYKRSFGSLGSTKNAKPFKNFDGQGLLSPLQKDNPLFYDWTKVFIIYCDGSEYVGSKRDPISYKDTKLYFRGYNNSIQHFRYLDQKFKIYDGDTIVLTGVSAGAMGTYFYSNLIFQNTRKAKFYAIPDSGLFLVDYYSPIVGGKYIKIAAQNLFRVMSSDQPQIAFPIKQCLQQFKDDLTNCFATFNLAKYLKAPLFIVQSPYDAYSIQNIIVTNCMKNKNPPFSLQNCNQTTIQAIQDYRRQINNALAMFKTRKNVGLWAPSCAQHGFTDVSTFTDNNFRIPSGTGLTVSEAIKQYLDDPDNAKWIADEVPWPYNSGCNGIANSKHNLREDLI